MEHAFSPSIAAPPCSLTLAVYITDNGVENNDRAQTHLRELCSPTALGLHA
jgi:hypothetical protein